MTAPEQPTGNVADPRNVSAPDQPEASRRREASDLRDRIAEALYQWTLKAAAARVLFPPHEDALRENSLARADAVLGVVQPEIDRIRKAAQGIASRSTQEAIEQRKRAEDAERDADRLDERLITERAITADLKNQLAQLRALHSRSET